MADLLVSLLHLPDIKPLLKDLEQQEITIRRPETWEITKFREFIEKNFARTWADESSVSFANKPVSAFVALHKEEIVGFAVYECSRKNYFGPSGVIQSYQKKGIGKALFWACLYGLQDLGYSYAIIGGAGPVEFYKKAANAIVIPFEESKGIYQNKKEPRLYD